MCPTTRRPTWPGKRVRSSRASKRPSRRRERQSASLVGHDLSRRHRDVRGDERRLGRLGRSHEPARARNRRSPPREAGVQSRDRRGRRASVFISAEVDARLGPGYGPCGVPGALAYRSRGGRLLSWILSRRGVAGGSGGGGGFSAMIASSLGLIITRRGDPNLSRIRE